MPSSRPAAACLPRHARGERIELDFPTQHVAPAEPEAALLEALGGVDTGGDARGRRPLAARARRRHRGAGASTPDFVGRWTPTGSCASRAAPTIPRTTSCPACFGPAHGIDEDPVTGSTHCVLSAYWAERLGRSELVGYQASRRGGVVHVRLAGDRTLLAGHAVTVLEGELTAPP